MLRHNQLTDQEKTKLQLASGHSIIPLILKIYRGASNRAKKKERFLDKSSNQLIGITALEDIRSYYSALPFQLDGNRPLPELAKALREYLKDARNITVAGLTEKTNLQEIVNIIFVQVGKGDLLARRLVMSKRADDNLHSIKMRLQRAHKGSHPYWSDDWELVRKLLENYRYINLGVHRRKMRQADNPYRL